MHANITAGYEDTSTDEELVERDLTIDVLVMGLVFGLGARSFRRFVSSPMGQRRVSIVFGTLFIGLGLALVWL